MSEAERLCVVVNNAAARARLLWPQVRETLARAGVRFSVYETKYPDDAQLLTRAALLSGTRTVAAVGGDGTLSEVASGFFEPREGVACGALPRSINADAALAVLPAGTGDDFARGLTGGKRAPLDEWVARLVRHCRRENEDVETTRRVDVLYGSTSTDKEASIESLRPGLRRFICLNAATLGIGAEVAARVAAQGKRLRLLPGEVRFAWAALGALAAWRNRRLRIRIDDGDWKECRTNLVAVVNGPYAGGGMNFAPAASVDDGTLDVVTACDLTRPVIVRELTRIHRGGHLANPRVHLSRGTRVRIEAHDKSDNLMLEADGDLRGRLPAELRVVPAALRIVW